MNDDQISLHFRFVLPRQSLLEVPSYIRVKVENGVVFFKPGLKGTTTDSMTIKQWYPSLYKTKMESSHVLFRRLMILLERLGWTMETPYLTLHIAQRGWYAVTLTPTARAPDVDSYVFMWLLDLSRRLEPMVKKIRVPVLQFQQ